MKVLLLTIGYPPQPYSGSRRAINLVRAFRRAGHDVEVITPRVERSVDAEHTEEPGVSVRRVWRPRHPVSWYGAVKRLAANLREMLPTDPTLREEQKEESGAFNVGSCETKPAWRRVPLSLLCLPDKDLTFVPSAVLRGLLSLRDGVDLIYTTSPSHSTHLAGLLLKQLSGLPWIMELRDPWTVDGSPLKPVDERSTISDRLQSRMERRCLSASDLCVVVSEGIGQIVREGKGLSQTKILMARNGIPRLVGQSCSNSDPRHRPYRITHLGNLYSQRDARPFLSALASFLEKSSRIGKEDLEVLFVGKVTSEQKKTYSNHIREHQLEGVVRFRGWVPHAVGQKLLADSDLLLIFAQEQPLQVPNKLYEYLGMRKPIVAFADAEGETADILRSVGGHILITEESTSHDIESALESVIVSRNGANTGNWNELRLLRTEVQLGRVVQEIEKRTVAGRTSKTVPSR